MESDFCIFVIVIDILDGNVIRKELFLGCDIVIELFRFILMLVKLLKFWSIFLLINIFKFFKSEKFVYERLKEKVMLK